MKSRKTYAAAVIAVGLSVFAVVLIVNYVIEGYTPVSRLTAGALALGALGVVVEIARPYAQPYIQKIWKREE